METYQEEYARILKEINELKKSPSLSDDERHKMGKMQERADMLRNYTSESGKLLSRISNLQTEITIDMTKIYQMQQIVAEHSADNSNLTNDEIQKMRKYLREITGSKVVNRLGENTLKEILNSQSKRYILSNPNTYDPPTKINELNQLCDTYRELQEKFLEDEKAFIDRTSSNDIVDYKEENHKTIEENIEELEKQKNEIIELKKLKFGVDNASKELAEKRKAIDADGNVSEEDAKKIEEAKKLFFEEIEEFKKANAKDLCKKIENDASEKTGLGIEEKDVERERIKQIIELLKVQIDVLKLELEALMKDPEANAKRIWQIQRELKRLDKDLGYWNSRYKDTQILNENSKDWKPLVNTQNNISNGQYVAQPTQMTYYQPVQSSSTQTTQPFNHQPVSADKQLRIDNTFIDKIKNMIKSIKNLYADTMNDEKKDIVTEAKIQAYSKKREERIGKLNENNFIGESVKKDCKDMYYLAFPPAKVVGADFYHTVQIGDKLQYIKEPLANIDFSEDAIKTKICELQDKFGDIARERQGRKIGITEKYRYNHKKMDVSEKHDYEMRQAYQKFLESPDKIVKDFLVESNPLVRRYKAINLMCALEAANNVEEAGKACLYGMPMDLFGLGLDSTRTQIMFGQLEKGSLQNDIEKVDMQITEKIKENLRMFEPIEVSTEIHPESHPIEPTECLTKAYPKSHTVEPVVASVETHPESHTVEPVVAPVETHPKSHPTKPTEGPTKAHPIKPVATTIKTDKVGCQSTIVPLYEGKARSKATIVPLHPGNARSNATLIPPRNVKKTHTKRQNRNRGTDDEMSI